MGFMKRWLENISVEMGFGGEINDEVMEEGDRRTYAMQDDLGEEEEDGLVFENNKWKRISINRKEGGIYPL